MLNKISFHYKHIFVVFGLIMLTLAVYWQTKNHDFVNYDDGGFIFNNPHVRTGLNFQNIKWALKDITADYWHPLTWISQMLDCELYGLNPTGHHLTNLLLHITNTVLLFLILNRMTGALWRSSFVAALFALHPLRVESVAWAAERKDVLSTLFFMLAIWAYINYVEHRGLKRYLLSLTFFALGLMSKPMLVTLPFILLLLDYWPLGRFRPESSLDNIGSCSESSAQMSRKSLLFRLISEKSLFLALALISSIITFFAQKSSGALYGMPLKFRLGNVPISYLRYIKKMVWPFRLSVFYPYQIDILTIWNIAGASLFLMCIFIYTARYAKQHKYLAVGWLWYVITLIPVIGIIQVGGQAFADRYTYVPIIGLFIIVSWGANELFARLKYRNVMLSLSGGAVLVILSMTTWNQLRYWENSIRLFEHAIKVTDNNHIAYSNLGLALAAQGKHSEAVLYFSKALSIVPKTFYIGYYNMGYSLAVLQRFNEAVPFLLKAIEINPEYAEANNILGYCLYGLGRHSEAIAHYSEALRIRPDYAEAHNNLGVVLTDEGKIDQAVFHYKEALKIRPNAGAMNNLGLIFVKQGKYDDAIVLYSKALRVDPKFKSAGENLKTALRMASEADRKSPGKTLKSDPNGLE